MAVGPRLSGRATARSTTFSTGRSGGRGVDAPEPEKIDTGSAEIAGVAVDDAGDVVVNPWEDITILADDAAGARGNTTLDESGDFITATDGITVRILPPDVDVDDLGYVAEFRSPARLEVERDGEVEWTIHAGRGGRTLAEPGRLRRPVRDDGTLPDRAGRPDGATHRVRPSLPERRRRRGRLHPHVLGPLGHGCARRSRPGGR